MATSDYSIASLIVVKGEMAKKTVIYDTEIKAYPFKVGVQVDKKGNLS